MADGAAKVGRETVRQHAAILRAIERRDADAAESAIVKHLTYLRRHLIAPADGSEATR